MAARSFHAVLDVSLLLIFGVNAASSSITVPDLGGLRNASEINYPKPEMTCHSDFKVTVKPGNWSLIAVDGHELALENQNQDPADDICVSSQPYGAITFNMQTQCNGTTTEVNNTYTFTLRARGEWAVESSQDRLYPMKCEFGIVGSAAFSPKDTRVTQFFSSMAPIQATRDVVINGTKIHLIEAAAPGKDLNNVTVGQLVQILVNATDTGSETSYIGITGCELYDKPPTDAQAMRFILINDRGCNDPPNYYDPFTATGKVLQRGVRLKGETAFTDEFKMLKFPGSTEIYTRCSVVFCVEADDQRCITPSCSSSRRRRRRRRRRDAPVDERVETVITKVTVVDPNNNGVLTKISGKVVPSVDAGGAVARRPPWRCGGKCVALVVVATVLLLANVVAISFAVKKSAARKKQLKIIDGTALEGNVRRIDAIASIKSESAMDQQLRALSPIETPATLKSYNTYI